MDLFNKQDLAKIGEQLIAAKETIAVAESVTSGMLQYSFSNTPDAARFFQGGVTAYNVGQKFKHLNVEPIHAISCNCVSQRVANQMASSVCEAFQSDWGIGITGYATPTPQSGQQVFAYIAIVRKTKLLVTEKMDGRAADPAMIQLEYVNEVLRRLGS